MTAAVRVISPQKVCAPWRVSSVWPGPGVRAADPGGVPDRQGAGIDLLAVIGRDLRGEVAA
jgi:hypothetical protein